MTMNLTIRAENDYFLRCPRQHPDVARGSLTDCDYRVDTGTFRYFSVLSANGPLNPDICIARFQRSEQ